MYGILTWLFTKVYIDFGVTFDLMLANKCFIYWRYVTLWGIRGRDFKLK
jgi:hypothetical protein